MPYTTYSAPYHSINYSKALRDASLCPVNRPLQARRYLTYRYPNLTLPAARRLVTQMIQLRYRRNVSVLLFVSTVILSFTLLLVASLPPDLPQPTTKQVSQRVVASTYHVYNQ